MLFPGSLDGARGIPDGEAMRFIAFKQTPAARTKKPFPRRDGREKSVLTLVLALAWLVKKQQKTFFWGRSLRLHLPA
jgi:hypothetical protein